MKNKQQILLVFGETVKFMRDNHESEILNLLQKNQSATVEELAEKTFVSLSTVRRKLNDMQNKGLITRTHGGAKLNDENNFFPSFTFRSHQNCLEKKKIALSAIKLIKNGDVIFLDGSTSAFFIAEYLSEFKNIKVITNGIDTLSLLSKNNIEAYSTGGYVSLSNRSVLVGHYASEMISNIHADLTFFSAQSVDGQGEIYDCFEEENVLRKQMLKNCSKSVLLCDSTKFGQLSPYRLCSLEDIDVVVSDQNIIERLSLKSLKKIPQFMSL